MIVWTFSIIKRILLPWQHAWKNSAFGPYFATGLLAYIFQHTSKDKLQNSKIAIKLIAHSYYNMIPNLVLCTHYHYHYHGIYTLCIQILSCKHYQYGKDDSWYAKCQRYQDQDGTDDGCHQWQYHEVMRCIVGGGWRCYHCRHLSSCLWQCHLKMMYSV